MWRPAPAGQARTMPIVEVKGLYKRYGDRAAVDGVSFDVREGEIFGILGSNGAGKTTTAECVSGLRAPDEGTVRVAGLDPVADRRVLTELLGAQLQQSELQPKLTVQEALDLYASFYPRPADGTALAGFSAASRATSCATASGKVSTSAAGAAIARRKSPR